MNDSDCQAQGSKCDEQLKVVDDMKTLGRELNVVDAIISYQLWMI